MNNSITGRVHLLGDDINTDTQCSNKYLPGKDVAYVAQHAFEQVSPGFASRFKAGDVIVAGRNFGTNSSREQAVQVMRLMGASAVVAPSFARQFFRSSVNNGLPAVVCDIAGIADGDEITIDLAQGSLAVPAREIHRKVAALPPAMQAILSEGGLIPFLQKHPDWKIA